MKLFYVRAEVNDGDSGGATNMDLFVHADAPSRAVELWAAHYAGWSQPDDDKVLVYDINQLAICPGVLAWNKIPVTIHKAPQL